MRKTKAERWHGKIVDLVEGEWDELYFYDHDVKLEEMFDNEEILDKFKRITENMDIEAKVTSIASFRDHYNYRISNERARWTLWTEDLEMASMRAFDVGHKPGCGAFKVTRLVFWEKRVCPHLRQDGTCSLRNKKDPNNPTRILHRRCDHDPIPEDSQECFHHRLLFWRMRHHIYRLI